MLVLYDVTSSYFEGHHCPLAQYGHSRDHRSDPLQIVYGLLCTREGLSIAIEVFEGNAADPTGQIDKVKGRFAITRIVMIGDRGMITKARIRDDLVPSGLDWITCLRAPQIQALAQEGGPLQLSLFDERDLAEITSPDFPGERLIVCRNRELAKERARKRQALLLATEKELLRVQAQVRRKGSHRSSAHGWRDRPGGWRSGERQEDGQTLRPRYPRRPLRLCPQGRADRSRSQARWHLCHPYRRAGRGSQRCACGPGVQRSLSGRAGVPLHEDRRSRDPPHSALECRSRAGPCLSVHHVEWHLRQALAPLLFHDTDLDVARAERSSPVVSTEPSPAARTKKAIKRNANGDRVNSFAGLIDHLGTMTRNSMRMPLAAKHPFTLLSKPTPLQEAAFNLLGFDPKRVQ